MTQTAVLVLYHDRQQPDQPERAYHAVITLSGVTFNNEGSNVLLSVCDDGWNGAFNTAELVMDAQGLSSAILMRDNYTMTLTL